MRKIYTGIDIGSHSIKVVVAEVINKKFQVLASSTVNSRGVKNGWIIEYESTAQALKKALDDIESVLGVKIDKALVCIPSENRNLTIVTGNTKTSGEDNTVNHTDIINVLQEAVVGKTDGQDEVVTVVPISFNIDNQEGVKNPVGLKGKEISVKAVVATVPKVNINNVFKLMKMVNVEIVDIAFSETGDYYTAKNRDYDSKVGVVVNIGYETTKVSIYNKGIMINNEVLEFGSKIIDQDIQSFYDVPIKTARKLKESFAVSNTRYADVNDHVIITNRNDEKRKINQLELSELVETRLIEILRMAKKQINILTNREISYIIITGGISELAGFQYVVDNVLGRGATTLNITTMGIRNNKYSSAIGIIKYFHEKLELRGKNYSMFDEALEKELINTSSNNKIANDTMISKVFGYFTGSN